MVDCVLVTGGTGLVGRAIQAVAEKECPGASFYFASSKDADLTSIVSILLFEEATQLIPKCSCLVLSSQKDTEKLFELAKPTHIIHLAALVGGLFKNMDGNLDFLKTNLAINGNVLEIADKYNVVKTISCLSTCIFPDKTSYPIDETMIHNGPPHSSNFGYSYAKRMIDVMNTAYTEKYSRIAGDSSNTGKVFTSVVPTNVYGPHDNFNLKDGHVIPGLIHKAYTAVEDARKRGDKNAILKVYGSGRPMRQFIYSQDLARLILWTLKNYQSSAPLILSVDPAEEISIADAAKLIVEAFQSHPSFCASIKLDLEFDHSMADGQFKKTASNAKLRTLYPEFQFTPIEKALSDTVIWFIDNFNEARK